MDHELQSGHEHRRGIVRIGDDHRDFDLLRRHMAHEGEAAGCCPDMRDHLDAAGQLIALDPSRTRPCRGSRSPPRTSAFRRALGLLEELAGEQRVEEVGQVFGRRHQGVSAGCVGHGGIDAGEVAELFVPELAGRFSFIRTLVTCFSTVRSETKSRSAIARVGRPRPSGQALRSRTGIQEGIVTLAGATDELRDDRWSSTDAPSPIRVTASERVLKVRDAILEQVADAGHRRPAPRSSSSGRTRGGGGLAAAQGHR